MKIDSHYQQQKCSPVTLVSGDIRFKPIFAGRGFPRRGHKTTERLLTTAIFSRFWQFLAISSETLDIKPALLYSDCDTIYGAEMKAS